MERAGELAPARAPRGLSAAQPPAPPRPGRAAALTPSLDPPRPGRTGGSLVAAATSDPRMLNACHKLSPHRGCRAVGESGAPDCPDAGSTLPAAAPRPRSGHARPVPKEEARYRCGRAGGGVSTTRQTLVVAQRIWPFVWCLTPGLLTQGQYGEPSSSLDLGSTTGKGLEVGLTGPSFPAVP